LTDAIQSRTAARQSIDRAAANVGETTNTADAHRYIAAGTLSPVFVHLATATTRGFEM
jgi:hypothetical protein